MAQIIVFLSFFNIYQFYKIYFHLIHLISISISNYLDNLQILPNHHIINMKKQTIKKWVKGFMRKQPQTAPKQETYEVEVFYDHYNQDISAEAELINQLIHMNVLIKMTRQVNYEQFLCLKEINRILCQQEIDLNNCKKALMGGINILDEYSQRRYITNQLPYQYYSVRSLLWKINCGYLPKQCIQKWVSKLEKHHAIYNSDVQNLIILKIEKKLGLLNPVSQKKMSVQLQKAEIQNEGATEQKERHKSAEKTKDHPLNFSGESKWKSYFEDVELWKRIEKDIRRTRNQLKFFQQPYSFELTENTILKPDQLTFSQEKQQTYADALNRILFIYIKNHSEEHYVQGMNEMVALIFYAFTNKNSEYMRRVSESDSYFMFEFVMAKLPRKHFLKGEQYSKKFIQVVKKVDLRLYEQIQQSKMVDAFKMISIRWFLSGFLSEFNIDDALFIWDCAISWAQQLGVINTFMYIGLALMHLNRNRIIEQKNLLQIFTKIQNSPIQIVEKTKNLYKLFPKLFQSP